MPHNPVLQTSRWVLCTLKSLGHCLYWGGEPTQGGFHLEFSVHTHFHTLIRGLPARAPIKTDSAFCREMGCSAAGVPSRARSSCWAEEVVWLWLPLFIDSKRGLPVRSTSQRAGEELQLRANSHAQKSDLSTTLPCSPRERNFGVIHILPLIISALGSKLQAHTYWSALHSSMLRIFLLRELKTFPPVLMVDDWLILGERRGLQGRFLFPSIATASWEQEHMGWHMGPHSLGTPEVTVSRSPREHLANCHHLPPLPFA